MYFTIHDTIQYDTRYRKIKNQFTIRFCFETMVPMAPKKINIQSVTYQ